MQTSVKEDGPFEKIVTVQLDEPELEPAKNAAAKKLSHQLSIKGFRPGKAPRPIVEKMVGAEVLRAEAIDDGIPDLVSPALEELDVESVTPPRIEDIRDRDSGGVEVDIRITMWPSLETIPALDRKIEVVVPEVTDEEMDEQIDRLRSQYAELEDVERPADEGDFVMINLSAETDGALVEDVAADDLLYEVGSASYIPGLDDILGGASAGDIRSGPATLPPGFGDNEGSEVTLKALVKGVRAKKLPELTDDWVSDVSEFESVSDLKERLEHNLLATKKNTISGEYREELFGALIDDLDLDLPESLIEAEMQANLHNMSHSLEQQGLDLATYLSITGQDQAAFAEDLKQSAARSLKTRILLEGIAESESLEVTEDDISGVLEEMAESTERSTEDVRETLEASGQVSVLTGDILRQKALDLVLESSTPVDADGTPVDLTIPPLDEDDEESEDHQPAPQEADEEV